MDKKIKSNSKKKGSRLLLFWSRFKNYIHDILQCNNHIYVLELIIKQIVCNSGAQSKQVAKAREVHEIMLSVLFKFYMLTDIMVIPYSFSEPKSGPLWVKVLLAYQMVSRTCKKQK